MKHKFYSLEKNKQTATLTIYGDITSWPWLESDVSATNLSKQLETMGDVNQIDVYINSYGGEVAEGLAIYNALKRHKAHVTTICDGFACSIASVIFLAGDERIMNESSLLMIHNAWSFAQGNAEELRKQADDLDKITKASVEAYKAHSTLSEEEIKELMDAETWILPDEALEYGFATAVGIEEKKAANQSAWLQLFEIVKAHKEKEDIEEEPDAAPDDDEADESPEDDTSEDETETDEPEEAEAEDEESEEEAVDDESEDETEEEPEDESEDETNTDEEEKPAQKWSGFFNALLNI